MASIHRDQESGFFRIMFRFGKPAKQYRWSLTTKDENEAKAERGRIEGFLKAITNGYVHLPPDVDFQQFVLSGGNLKVRPTVQEALTLAGLFALYEEQLPPGSIEANTSCVWDRENYTVGGNTTPTFWAALEV